ncbi:MAG: M28 family peptidase [bacterium]
MKRLLFILCFAAILAGCGEKTSPEAQANRLPLTFTTAQAANALSNVVAFVSACTPRDGGTPGSEGAAVWLHSRLTRLGVPTTIDRFNDSTPEGQKPFANVLATLPGTGDEWVVLLSHFDTKCKIANDFQGANDGGSSTGLLLELAAALHHTATPRRLNVLCAFLDGEECRLGYSDRDGFHGSKHLANAIQQQHKKVKAVILMDMVGDRDLKITIPHNGTARLRVLALEAAEATGDRAKIGLFDGIIYDDHQAFLERGFPAINLIDLVYGSRPGENDYWHTTHDTLDKLSADSLLTTGRIVMEMVNRL